jgi:hypothetical protein
MGPMDTPEDPACRHEHAQLVSDWVPPEPEPDPGKEEWQPGPIDPS